MARSTKQTLITGNEAAAYAARLARVEVIPNYPITPQTEMLETLSEWIADGTFKTEFLRMDSEHSVMSAAIGASAAGSRVFTGTSSQGLFLMYEMLYIASGLRLPIVMANMSRGISAPITLWADHDDFLSML
ncbi:pyruvate ferredoxin oxidoreductase, partial [Candidatus Micrarchaeota archaeon]|nr:pyruvate ferredoxin oxidoreductase [Candidatus Micrarchaeota archaeon]